MTAKEIIDTDKMILAVWVANSNLREVAKRAKVSTATLHRFLRGRDITVSNLLKMDRYVRRKN